MAPIGACLCAGVFFFGLPPVPAWAGPAATFSAKTDFTTGKPKSVALGDVNGDGDLDLITANYGPDTASVLLGDGAGSFGTKTDFTTATGPRSVALGDVDGDGDLDMITANRTAATASVLLGNGAGSFGTKTDFTTANGPYSVALGDVDEDGDLDLVTSNYHYSSGSKASVLLNTTAYTPANSVSPTSGSTAGATAVTITGTNFTGATAVTFGGTNAASFTVNSDTQITATTPAGSAGAIAVKVATPRVSVTTAAAFTYTTPTTPAAPAAAATTSTAAPTTAPATQSPTSTSSDSPSTAAGAGTVDIVFTCSPSQVVPGQKGKFCLDVSETTTPSPPDTSTKASAGINGSAAVLVNNRWVCSATISYGNGSCAGVIKATGALVFSAAFTGTTPTSTTTAGASATTASATATASAQSRSIAIDRATTRILRCRIQLVVTGRDLTAGKHVTLQRENGKKWTTIAATKVKKNKTWKITTIITTLNNTVRASDGTNTTIATIATKLANRGC